MAALPVCSTKWGWIPASALDADNNLGCPLDNSSN